MIRIDDSGLKSKNLLMKYPEFIEKCPDIVNKFNLYTGSQQSSPVYTGYRTHLLQKTALLDSEKLAKELQAQFEYMVVLGIGGSALGAKAVFRALEWGLVGKPVHIIENIDPIDFELVWRKIVPAKTVFVVISKSGETLETMAALSLVCDRLKKLNLTLSHHIVAITDPEKGALKKWAIKNSLRWLSIPQTVGGRFSVFTPVGLLPLAFGGLNVSAFVQGGISQLTENSNSLEPLVALSKRFVEFEKAGISTHCLFSYCTSLKDLGAWFVQLWGESLGKKNLQSIHNGMLPFSAVGATDQHSLLQFLVEGREVVLTGFLKVKNFPKTCDVIMPVFDSDFSATKFAENKKFSHILNVEQTATQEVLKNVYRPNYTLEISELNPEAIGALMAWFMDLTVLMGLQLNLNPFDQPGVEHGKKLFPQLM